MGVAECNVWINYPGFCRSLTLEHNRRASDASVHAEEVEEVKNAKCQKLNRSDMNLKQNIERFKNF